MLKRFRYSIARFISPERERELSNNIERLEKLADDLDNQQADYQQSVDRRVAEIISKQDPLEPLLRNFNGVFSPDKQQPEDGLDEISRTRMEMFGYRNHKDETFHYLLDWVTNTHISAMLKRPMLSDEQIVHAHMYARALIAVSSLLKEKIGRLSSLYEQRTRRAGAFDAHVTVE